MRKVLTILLITLLSSCTTQVKLTEIARTESRDFVIPSIGIETTAYIGEQLIREGRSSARDAIYLNNDHGKAGWTEFHPSGFYILIGKSKNDSVYQHRTIMPGMLVPTYPQIIETQHGVYLIMLADGRKQLNRSEYTKRQFIEETSDDFEQTLIYTGAEGTLLRFTYREFSNNMARSAYTIDATYDIRTDKIIRFRGALIEVIKTDNQSITYKILSGFKSNR